MSVSPLRLAVVLGTVLRVFSKLVRRRVRRRAQCGALASGAESLLVSVQLILLHLVPLTVIFLALRLTVGHYLADKLFDLVSFNLLRGQVLAVLSVNLVHSANDLILQRFFEGARPRDTDAESHRVLILVGFNVVEVTFLTLGFESILYHYYFLLGADPHSDWPIV